MGREWSLLLGGGLWESCPIFCGTNEVGCRFFCEGTHGDIEGAKIPRHIDKHAG